MISTSKGLAQWFADEVKEIPQGYAFMWDDVWHPASILGLRENKFIKFRWIEEEPYCYFQIEIREDELTGDFALFVTDFVLEEDKEEKIELWNIQIRNLLSLVA